MNPEPIEIAQMLRDEGRNLRLRVKAGAAGLSRLVSGEELHRSGLVLTGFTELFPEHRIQVLGNTEMLFLKKLKSGDRRKALELLFGFKIPCVVVTAGNRLLPDLIELSESRSIPLLSSSLPTTTFVLLLSSYLNSHFAPHLDIHGTLVDVYGTGLLFIGRAGIGKSEIALDLVERGHRLVADDVVTLVRRPPGVLIGHGPEMLEHLIEVRGVGVLSVRDIFGVRAVRMQKRVEMVVELRDWEETGDYERLGLEERYAEYLNLKIPLVQLPIYPGKNITVICEAIALNLHLKVYGLNAAKELNRKLHARMRNKRRIKDYLKWDDE